MLFCQYVGQIEKKDISPTVVCLHHANGVLPPLCQRWADGKNYVRPTSLGNVGPTKVLTLSHHWASVSLLAGKCYGLLTCVSAKLRMSSWVPMTFNRLHTKYSSLDNRHTQQHLTKFSVMLGKMKKASQKNVIKNSQTVTQQFGKKLLPGSGERDCNSYRQSRQFSAHNFFPLNLHSCISRLEKDCRPIWYRTRLGMR